MIFVIGNRWPAQYGAKTTTTTKLGSQAIIWVSKLESVLTVTGEMYRKACQEKGGAKANYTTVNGTRFVVCFMPASGEERGGSRSDKIEINEKGFIGENITNRLIHAKQRLGVNYHSTVFII